MRPWHRANRSSSRPTVPLGAWPRRVDTSMRPLRRADRSGRRSTAPSASHALGPTRLQYPAQTRPSGYRRSGCQRQERRPSNGRHDATAACLRLSSGGLSRIGTTKRPTSSSLRSLANAQSVTQGSTVTTRDQRRTRGCPCCWADRWRAAVDIADNRAVGNHSALFELQAPGELAQMKVEPTARLTGCPTGPTGDMDSPSRKTQGAKGRRKPMGAGWPQ